MNRDIIVQFIFKSMSSSTSVSHISTMVSDEDLAQTILAQSSRILTEEETQDMVNEIRDQERNGESRILCECIREIEISVVYVLQTIFIFSYYVRISKILIIKPV